MKLKYNIIWIEDKFTDSGDSDGRAFTSIKESVETFLKEEFFDIDSIEIAGDFESFKEVFDDKKEYDLIITDLSLNNGTTGQQVIDFIRNTKHNLTEILFYSANKALKETELINNSRISYFNLTGDYKDLEKEIKNLITLTIKKFQNIVAMRGMIMHETSSLDVDFHNILKTVINNKEGAINRIKDRYKKFNSDNNIHIDTDIKIDDLLLQIGASHRWKGLKENIEEGQIKTILNDYDTDIINIRNKFAHAILEKDENGREFFRDKKDGIDFNDAKCKEIREKIIIHKENIDKLKKAIE